jgi:hypothetical protein
MSDPESSNFEFVYAEPQAVHHTVDGSFLEVKGFSNVSHEREREILAEGYGIEPDQLVDMDDRRNQRGRRLSVGFSKWRSSWDPHAAKSDPSLN